MASESFSNFSCNEQGENEDRYSLYHHLSASEKHAFVRTTYHVSITMGYIVRIDDMHSPVQWEPGQGIGGDSFSSETHSLNFHCSKAQERTYNTPFVCFYSSAGAASPVARCDINRLKPAPTNIAMAVDRHMSAIEYGLYVPTTATRRMAVKGAPSKSPTAADSMHKTRMETGMIGNSKCSASATIVAANKVGNIGPPR